MSVYDYAATALDGSTVSLEEFKGKVLLVVNTATGCGFTPQYDMLESMYAKFRDKGFEILDFPCNQFGNQAPGTDEEIHEFCTLRFGTEFPQFRKIEVNGADAHPLFVELAKEKPFQGFNGGMKALAMNKVAKSVRKQYGDAAYIMWNFTKFLIDREGNVVARFEPTEHMDMVESAVAAQL